MFNVVWLNLCNVQVTTNKTIVEKIFQTILRQFKMGKCFGEKIVLDLIFGNGVVPEWVSLFDYQLVTRGIERKKMANEKKKNNCLCNSSLYYP